MTKEFTSKPRNSSFELLRLVCILFIIAHHYYYHGNLGLPFNENNLTTGKIFLQIMSVFGRNACSIFVLISGYFMINSNCVNVKRLIILLLEMLTYSTIIAFGFRYFSNYEVTNEQLLKSILPIPYGNWFCVYYILFSLIIPQINKLLISLSSREYLNFILIILGVYCVLNTCIKNEIEFSNIDFFFVMYVIGGYIRLHFHINYSNRINLFICILSGLIMMISVIIIDYVGIKFHKPNLIEHATYFQQFNTIPAVLFSISTFLFFKRLSIHNRIINYLGKSVLGIYLIHDNDVLRKIIWCKIFPNELYMDFPYFHFIIKIILVFILALIIDIIRRNTVEKIILKVLDNRWVAKYVGNKNFVDICKSYK